MTRTVSRDGIARRLEICLARERDAGATVAGLARRFGAGTHLVSDALHGGAAKWRAMLGGHGGGNETAGRETRLAVIAEPVLVQGTVTGFKYRAAGGGGGWVAVPGKTVHAVLDAVAGEGWRLVALARLSGREPFQGTYELYLAR